ncbi:unnamed protein product, partial [Brenthis ino]
MQTETQTGEKAPSTSGPRRQKGRVFSKRSKGSENAAAPPLPPRDPNSAGPKPTRLSTVATKPKNEPMFGDIDMMGFPGVAPYRRTIEFAITAEGFIPLCEKEYDVIASNQPYFAKSVAKSAWVYYCTMSLYARLVTLKQEDDSSTYDEDSIAGQVLSGNHHLPTPIESYIKALGHIVDSSSIRYKLAMPTWPEEDDTFGRMGQHTHWKSPSQNILCKSTLKYFRVGVRVPLFYPENPSSWFALLRSQFVLANITADSTKYFHTLSQLEITYAAEVEDIIVDPPTLPTSKTVLIRRLSVSREKKFPDTPNARQAISQRFSDKYRIPGVIVIAPKWGNSVAFR